MTLDLRLLAHAIALANHGSYARAAQALHVSQPTLSRGIAGLEDSLGVRLFDRGRGGVEPTAFGRILLERGGVLLADEAALRRELQQLTGLESGELVVGAGPFAAAISVGRAMTRLLAKHPQIRARIARADPDQVVRDVLAGRCDLGVAGPGASRGDPRLQLEPLQSHPIQLFARPDHPLAGRPDITLSDVLAFPLVCSRVRSAVAARLLRDGPAGRVDPDTGDFLPAITIDSLDLARHISASTSAILPAVRDMVAEDVREGALVLLDFREPWMETDYRLLQRRDRTLSPAARAFVDELRAVEAEISALSVEPGTRASGSRLRSQKRTRPRTRASGGFS
jgi:DNA-binding transcriptional LysR family regulator